MKESTTMVQVLMCSRSMASLAIKQDLSSQMMEQPHYMHSSISTMGAKHLIIAWLTLLIVTWTGEQCRSFRTLYTTIIQVSNYTSRLWSSHPTCLQHISAKLPFALMSELTADVTISQLQLQEMKLQSFFLEMVINHKTLTISFFTVGMASLFSALVKCIQCICLFTMFFFFQQVSWGGTRECFVQMHLMHMHMLIRMMRRIPWTTMNRQFRSEDM